MPVVTRTGTVKSVVHTKVGSTHDYTAEVEYTYPNPTPPPPELTVTETHKELDKEFYDDFRNRVGKSITTTYEDSDTNRTVSGVKIT